MRIWIDLANSPHVPFFRALAGEFVARGHETEVTAREFAQTIELAEAAGLGPAVVGGHGGGRLSGKAGNLRGARVGARALGARPRVRPRRQSQLLLADRRGARCCPCAP